jgi:hypothetical protein
MKNTHTVSSLPFSALAIAFAFLIAVACFGKVETAKAQGGFPKKGRSPAHGSAAFGKPGNGSQVHGAQRGSGYRGNGNRGNSGRGNGSRVGYKGHNYSGVNRNRSYFGTGHRNSFGHFQGLYVPIVPYQYRSGFGINTSVFHGSYPVYPSSVYRQSYGYSVNGLNPAYSTYGSYLNAGNAGVLSSNVYGSSVAAQQLQRLRDQQQQQRIDANLAAANDQNLELMRLRLELERARAMNERQRLLKPAVEQPNPNRNDDAATQAAIDQLGMAPVIEVSKLAADSQLKAERAFRAGEYGKAARFAGLATSLDESSGKLKLFASQAHFANGEYSEAAMMLVKATRELDSLQLGWVVENFKLFYGQNDFVNQTRSLSAHLKLNPSDGNAWLLRGYQYGALGYPDAARSDLSKAKEFGVDAAVVDKMLERFAQ